MQYIYSRGTAKVLSGFNADVIPGGYDWEPPSYKMTKRLGLPTETLGNDGVDANRLGLPNPAGR